MALLSLPNLPELSCLALLHRSFFGFDLHLLVLDFEAQSVVDAHVLVRHPDQRKERQDVTAPILKQQLEAGEQQESCGDVVAEAVLTGEKVEELANENASGAITFPLTILARFSKNFLMVTVHATQAIGTPNIKSQAT
jgi:hypothetical protein